MQKTFNYGKCDFMIAFDTSMNYYGTMKLYKLKFNFGIEAK